MIIQEDSRQQAGKHDIKHAAFGSAGDTIIRCKLPFGDYALPPAVAVDTKASMQEIAQNIGGTREEHERFKRELIAARDAGCHLYVLVENDEGIEDIDGVESWHNPREDFSPKCIQGQRLAKAMRTIQERYGCTFLFCRPEDAGETIIDLLR